MFKRLTKAKLFVVALIYIVSFALGGASYVGVNESGKQIIRIGCVSTGDFIYSDATGEYAGFGSEYLQTLEKYGNISFAVRYGTNAEVKQWLDTEKVDIAFPLAKTTNEDGKYLYSNKACATDYALLATCIDNEKYFYDDITSFSDLKVGFVKNATVNESFDQHLFDRLPNVEKFYYENDAEMKAALSNGTIDAVATNIFGMDKDLKILAKAARADDFFVSLSKNERTLNLINYATEKLFFDKEYFNANLYGRYYTSVSQMPQAMTRNESDYISSSETIRVVCDNDNFPYEFLDPDDNQIKGVYPDILKRISEITGLTFELYSTPNGYAGAWEEIQNGNAEIISGTTVNSQIESRYNISGSVQIAKEYNMFVGRSKENLQVTDNLTIALNEGYVATKLYIATTFPNWKIVLAKSNNECLGLANSGLVDIAITSSIAAQANKLSVKFPDLVTLFDETIEKPVCFGISKDSSPLLKQVIDKALLQLDEEVIEQSIAKHTLKYSNEGIPKKLADETILFVSIGILLLLIAVITILVLRSHKLSRMATTDSLTGLLNRDRFLEISQKLVFDNIGKRFALLSVDIDKFRAMNEIYGYATGDVVLISVANALRKIGKDFDAVVGRSMSDSYTILIEDKDDNLKGILEHLTTAIIKDYTGAFEFFTKLKTGVYQFSANTRTTVAECINKANLSKRKLSKSDESIAYYDKEIRDDVEVEKWIDLYAEAALASHEFKLYYQPKYNLASDDIVGAEALIRWVSAEKGIIFPDQFIPMFEKNGFILRLDFYVYEEAMKFIRRQIESGDEIIPIAVNISRRHMLDNGFVRSLVAITERYGISPSYVELELTESTFSDIDANTIGMMEELRQKGYTVSIDDFGSGFSSLNLLKEVPADILKLDKGFLQESSRSQRDRTIITKVVEMAKAIGMMTLCEGVERQEQADFLNEIGCEMVQGYLYARPMPEQAFLEYLKNKE